MNSKDQLKCNQCLQLFNMHKIPYKLLACFHNICQQCLQQIHQIGLHTITCSFCGKCNDDLEKNMLQINQYILSKIRDKHDCVLNNSDTSVSIYNISLKIQQDQLTTQANQLLLTQQQQSISLKSPHITPNHPQQISLTKPQLQICKQHDKQLQIICITDLQMICPHCAIFGNHKSHTFKTLKQFKQDYQYRCEKLQIIKQQKYINDKKIKTMKQKNNIQILINTKKTQLCKQISNIFTKLIKDIQILQQTICEDLNRSFSQIYKQIIIMLEQQNKIQQQYNKWQSQYQNLLYQIDKNQYINSKIRSLYTTMNLIQYGQELVNKLENKYQVQNMKICNIVQSISIQHQPLIDISKIIRINRKIQENKKDNFVNMLEKLNLSVGKHVIQEIDGFNQNSFMFESKQDLSLIIQPDLKRVSTKSVLTKRNQAAKTLTSTTKFRSPNRKPQIGTQSKIFRVKSNTEIKINDILSNTSNPNITSQKNQRIRDPKLIVTDFIKHDLKQVLDLSRCQMTDEQIAKNLKQVRKHRKIRGLKLCQNYLTDHGFEQIIQYIGSTTNLNLSYNKLTQQVLSIIINNRDQISPLRIVNLSFNNLNEKKSKTRIDALKKMGIIVNI